MEQQAIDRCHRIGQKKVVHVHYFVGEDTVEQDVWDKSSSKRRMAETMLHDPNREVLSRQSRRRLTFAEMQRMIWGGASDSDHRRVSALVRSALDRREAPEQAAANLMANAAVCRTVALSCCRAV